MTETAEVRLGDDLQGREPVPQRPEERVVDVPRVGDDDGLTRRDVLEHAGRVDRRRASSVR